MLVLGDRFGDYEILGEPMNGTTTHVFAVRHVVTHKPAALKLLHERWRWLPDVVTRFLNERRILTALRNPHIIAVFDSGDDAFGAPYMVLEWLPCPLTTLLDSTPLAPPLALRCAAQIAVALAALHEQGLVHRELRPKDILMAEQDLGTTLIRLSDVGCAKALLDGDVQKSATGGDGTAGRVAPPGSSPYLAPEQWRSGESVDSAADVYALGALLFQMLSGRLPFLAAEPQGLMYQHLFEAPPLNELPIPARAQTADLLDAMLAKRAEQRPRIADVCAQLLRMSCPDSP